MRVGLCAWRGRMERQKQQADSLGNEWYKRAQLALSKVRLPLQALSLRVCCGARSTPPCSCFELKAKEDPPLSFSSYIFGSSYSLISLCVCAIG